MSYEAMKASMERYANAKVESSVATFSGDSLRAIYDDIGRALKMEDEGKGKAKFAVCDGRKESGEPESWTLTKAGDVTIGTRNASTNCPPLPPEYCI